MHQNKKFPARSNFSRLPNLLKPLMCSSNCLKLVRRGPTSCTVPSWYVDIVTCCTTLIDKNLIHKNELFKVLGRGEITVALEVHANKFSETAKAAIEKAGGSIHTIGR